jgi:hypothetical protein
VLGARMRHRIESIETTFKSIGFLFGLFPTTRAKARRIIGLTAQPHLTLSPF